MQLLHSISRHLFVFLEGFYCEAAAENVDSELLEDKHGKHLLSHSCCLLF